MKKEITILITSYNSGYYLRETIESVIYQTYPNWKIILVDDASTDNSLDFVGDYLLDPRIKLIRNEYNVGPSTTYNRCLNEITTDFFMLLNGYDWLPHNSLELLMEEAENLSNDVALIVGKVHEVKETSRGIKRYRVISNEWSNNHQDRYELLLANYFPTVNFYRTSVIKNIGGWDTNDPYNGRYYEDVRMFLKLIEANKFRYIPHNIYNHRQYKENGSNEKSLKNKAFEWIINDALNRWGGHYEPIFKKIKGGRKIVRKLRPNVTDKKVTVLIPSYNPGHYLRDALESVFLQTYQNWRIVLVDDASTDNSLSTVSDYLEDPRVELIQNVENKGQSKAQNAGLAVIDTPLILMLDSDNWLFPNTLEIMIAEAESVSEDIALICGNHTLIYESEQGQVLRNVEVEGGKSFNDPYEFLLANYVPYPRLYRTSALKEVGGWPTDDPYEGRYLEDRRMDVLLIEKYKIHWVDCMLYNYRKHSNNLTVQRKDILNDMIRWNIEYALKRWGDQFTPVYGESSGWVELKELEPKL
ncbi:glycosyltransferase family 2 protein [Fictibacillus sp. KU28468]|uniref:glycosyltransferase family 2 protein n=1 Tax=Fictibacillus sp. KU28468 TaxID=2991053 RepID=UPI00223D0D75|nr:glycosyltransferase [Fictibacillus sp. KU28468]UZJ77313.1 glycosyltransferase [Fictibacillus sp. KU28468]